jgi:hypothetical protein
LIRVGVTSICVRPLEHLMCAACRCDPRPEQLASLLNVGDHALADHGVNRCAAPGALSDLRGVGLAVRNRGREDGCLVVTRLLCDDQPQQIVAALGDRVTSSRMETSARVGAASRPPLVKILAMRLIGLELPGYLARPADGLSGRVASDPLPTVPHAPATD